MKKKTQEWKKNIEKKVFHRITRRQQDINIRQINDS